MYCHNCGQQVDDSATFCPNCGIQLSNFRTDTRKQGENSCTLALVGFILSFIIAIPGLICSIIAYRKCVDEKLNGKGYALAGIIISSVSIALSFIYIIYFVSIIGIFSYAIFYGI